MKAIDFWLTKLLGTALNEMKNSNDANPNNLHINYAIKADQIRAKVKQIVIKVKST